MGTELPRWGSSLSPDLRGGPCVLVAAALSAGRAQCLLASGQHPRSQLLDRTAWPRLLLVSLWREETTLVRGCLRAALALLHKPECAPGQFRGTDVEGGPSRPPGTVWPGRLGLEKGGSAPAPHVHLADSGRVLLGSAGRAQVPEERRLPGNLPGPSGGPPGPWRALLLGLPQQTAWGRWPSAALAAPRRARPLSARRGQSRRDSRGSVEFETSFEKAVCVWQFLPLLRLWLR